MLRDYCEELMLQNPGTTITLDVEPVNNADEPTRQFRRIYVCLGALKHGFKACLRDLVGLDGAFMKGPFPGQVLTAVGVDPNNGIYPIAYAIVETENRESWTWFLRCLGPDLDLDERCNFTFISDRQKGIIQAVSNVFPSAEHRYCLKHIHDNMKLYWRGKAYKYILWRCAVATTVQQFENHMQEMKNLNVDAFNWLSKIPPKHWARSHFSVLNKDLVKARDKPIIACIDFIREYFMKRIVTVQKVIEKSKGPLTPAATELMKVIMKEAHACKTIWNGGDKYQVHGPWGEQVIVNTTTMTCTCRKWKN
uniref:uncharacterized protein LOC122595263 n=1 Tax=Erigeron canadensis TaxID=72917 RepID=UPI001CB92732|nr:uncharacterized protein LOC122595263 [Erigeron canadensis]